MWLGLRLGWQIPATDLNYDELHTGFSRDGGPRTTILGRCDISLVARRSDHLTGSVSDSANLRHSLA